MIHRKVFFALGLSLLIGPQILAAFSPPQGTARERPYQARQPFGVSLRASSSSSESDAAVNHVVFEYCTGCRWMARAFWMTQELLTTFNNDNLNAVTLIPSRPPPGARFAVSHYANDAAPTVLWDRAAQEGFPEVKELKQLVRDKISPDLFLGHSDKKERQGDGPSNVEQADEETPAAPSAEVLTRVLKQVGNPNVAIQYCTGCRWMLRSAYMGSELVTTFNEELNSLTLIPSRPPEKGGVFIVTVNGKVVWDRAAQGGFPEVKELKQVVRDVLVPSKDLGHSDNKDRISKKNGDDDNDFDDMDDDDAAEMRAYYGVR